jgi:hypothetical protein
VDLGGDHKRGFEMRMKKKKESHHEMSRRLL